MFLRQEGSSKNDHNHNKDLGYKLGTKNFATGPSGRGKTASRPSPPFLPPISREPNGFTEQLNHTEPPTQAVSPSLVAPVTADHVELLHDGTINRPDLSLTSIYDGPDSQLDNKSELQEPTPKEEPGQYALWDQLAADLQTGTSFESSNSFDAGDLGDETGIRSLGDENCLPPPEPNPPQARVDLCAATADENTDYANPQPGIKLGIKFAVNLPENGRTSSAPNYIRPPRGYQVPSYIMPPGYIRPPSSPVTPVYIRVPGFTAPTNNSPFKRGGTTGGPHPKRAAAN